MTNEHELANLLYGENRHRDNFLNDPTSDLTQPLERIEAANDAFRDALRAVEVSDQEGQQLTLLVQRYQTTAPTVEERATWQRESSEALARRYGPEQGRERLALAQKLAKSSGTFMATLSKAQLASHPRVVEILAERAWSMRAQGRL